MSSYLIVSIRSSVRLERAKPYATDHATETELTVLYGETT